MPAFCLDFPGYAGKRLEKIDWNDAQRQSEFLCGTSLQCGHHVKIET